MMNAKEWVEFLQNQGVDILVTSQRQEPWMKKNDGAYLCIADQVLVTHRLSKETIFHELGHWTGIQKRLNRDMDRSVTKSASELEECIAWEVARLMVTRFGGGTKYYYEIATLSSLRNSFETKWFGRQAYEFICSEFGL